MRLSQRLDLFYGESEIGLVIERVQVESLAKKAIRFYCGYAELSYYKELGTPHPEEAENVDKDVCTTDSEWAIISPLFSLYIEFANALQLEASRGLGVEVFGRDTGSIQADINEKEETLPKKAFFQEIETI